MKKIKYFLTIFVAVLLLTGCGSSSTNGNYNGGNSNPSSTGETSSNETQKEKEPEYTKESLEEEIAKQPVIVYSTNYLVQDSNYKCLYPDLLIANIKNNSGTDVKKVQVAFAAWDENGFPVKIDRAYVEYVNYDDVNLTNGQTFDDTGLALKCIDDSNIKSFKAVVVSYSDFDGNTWKNPLLNAWKSLYEDKKLN